MKHPLIFAGVCAALAGASVRADLTSDLVVYYDFEDLLNNPAASGPDATESGTGSYTGVSGGIVGNAAEFTGTTNDFINTAIGFGGGGSNQLGNSFTVSAWYNLDTDATSAASRFFVFEGATDYDISYGIRNLLNANGFNDTQTFTNGVGSRDFVDVHTPGTWQHVLMTYQSVSGTTTITTYIDGVAMGTPLSGPTTSLVSGGIHIGNARSSALNRAFDGKIDEFAAWSRALTAGEIGEVFARGGNGIDLITDLAGLNKAYINVSVSDALGGDVTGSGLYDVNDMPEIDLFVQPGFVFDGWTGPFTGQPEVFNHTVTTSVVSVAQLSHDLADPDDDGLTTFDEIHVYNTLPENPDSDGDNINDGDEINTTGTDPNFSDSLAINYILANLCTGGAPEGAETVSRDTVNDTLTLHIAADASTTLGGWADILPGDAGVAVGVAGDDLQLMVPGTPDGARFFRFIGGVPAQ